MAHSAPSANGGFSASYARLVFEHVRTHGLATEGVLEALGLREAVTKNSPGIPYWPGSPSTDYEAPTDTDKNGDRHFWDVWSGSKPIERYTDSCPRFMSEYGFQAFPDLSTIATFADPADFRIDSPVMKAHQKFLAGEGNDRITFYLKQYYRTPRDFADLVYLSQAMQARAIGLAFLLVQITLGLRPQLVTQVSESAQISQTTYSNSTLGNVDCSAVLANLDRLMADEHLYADQELSLASLAQRLQLSSHQLSELINAQLGKGFSRYLREQRSAAARHSESNPARKPCAGCTSETRP